MIRDWTAARLDDTGPAALLSDVLADSATMRAGDSALEDALDRLFGVEADSELSETRDRLLTEIARRHVKESE